MALVEVAVLLNFSSLHVYGRSDVSSKYFSSENAFLIKTHSVEIR